MAAIIKIEIVTSGGVDQVKKDVESLGSSAKSAGSGFSALGEVATGALRAIGEMAVNLAGAALSKIGDVLSDSISAAKESNMVAAQTAQVIKSTGQAAGVTTQHVLDYASALSAASGKSLFGDEQIAQSTNLLLTFTNIKKTTLDAATAISVDMAQAMGGAPKDAAIQLGKALNDPTKGLTALSRVGVSFTKEQAAQVTALQKSGDMMGAQKIILAELNKEFGGSAAAAAAADGGWAQFHDRLGEVEETIGKAILPLLGVLVGYLNTSILPAVESASNAFSAWLANPATQAGIQQVASAIQTGLGVAMAFITQQAIPALTNAWQGLQPVIKMVVGLFTNDLPPSLQTAATTFTQLQATVETVMQGINAVVAAVLPQISAFWQENGADITATVQATWNTLNQIYQTAFQLISAIVGPALTAMAGWISAHSAQIQQVLGDAWTVIKNLMTAALTLIQGVLTIALDAMHGDWSKAWADLQTMCATATLALYNAIKASLDSIAGYFGTSLDSIIETWSHNWDAVKEYVTTINWKQVGTYIIDGIISGVSGSSSALADAARQAGEDALEAIKRALGIASPSQVMSDEVGVPIVAGIIQGIQDTIPGLIGVIDQTGDAIVQANKKWSVDIKQSFEDSFHDIGDKLTDLAGSMSGTIADAFTGAASLDRAKAKALAAVDDISAAQQQSVRDQLAVTDKAASAMSDPKQATAFFTMRTNQIMEIAKLQSKTDGDLTNEQHAQIQQQIDQAKAALATATIPQQRTTLQDTITAGQKKLGGDLTDAARASIDNQIALITSAQGLERQASTYVTSAQSPIEAMLAQLAKLKQGADSLFTGKNGPDLPADLENTVMRNLMNLTNQLSSVVTNTQNVSNSSNSSVFNYQPTITTSAPVAAPNPVHLRAMAQM